MADESFKQKLEAYVRLDYDDEAGIWLENKLLAEDFFTQIVDDVQTEISDKCQLILCCYHWASVAGQDFYPIQYHPDKFRLLANPYEASIFWKKKEIDIVDAQDIYVTKSDSTVTGTPTMGALSIRTIKGIAVYPTPEASEGDGTFANDPLRILAYRLPLSIDTTDGEPEIDGDLHLLLKVGVKARVARKLARKFPALAQEAAALDAEYKAGLRAKEVIDGVRDTPDIKIHDVWSQAWLTDNSIKVHPIRLT